jgi:hypothetical protein
MDYRSLIPLVWSGVGIVAVVLVLRWMFRRGWVDLDRHRIRRGAGNAMMGLREFIEPSVEHIFEVEHAVPDDDTEGGDPKLPPRPIRQ